MKLFQGSVFRNFLSGYDESEAKRAFEVYKSEFVPKIKNIKSSKEEQYQYGFLDDLFVKVLGYTLNPSPNFNLTTELKNTTDSKKADGAIIKNDTVVGVIELKSTKTKTMEKIVAQAFGYKHSHEGCRYVITSNFEKLRFYIDYSDRFIEFNLFALEWEDFLKFYYLLSWKSIENDTPIKLKDASKVEEENISNELYKKYSKLRENLFANLVKNNPQIDKLTLLNKTQTLLDRMVFIFFAEDRGILPTNTIRAIIEHYQNDIEDRPLYHFYKIYFRAINEGNSKLKIQAYNGGLFEIDEILQSLIIDDDVLNTLPQELSKYDFNSDIDVNILGHIFENSLSDIEEFRAKIQDENFDFKLSKRKKDGVFYTPEFITKYIVKNTVGKLCEAKKEELGLVDIEIKIPKNPKKLTKNEQKIEENLKKYRNFLLSLKILDPACGSGAFLNQTLNFLLEEHSFIDEGIRTLMGGNVLGLFDIKKDILENNLYGVDINSEAVEIAKLSLWLRTVESGRKLNRLSGKIKVGNSLISDKTVAENAFVWEEEFPEVFEQGGFDVVIGNPPYGAKLEKEKKFFEIQSNESAILFMQKALQLLKPNGYHSFIIPKPFIFSSTWKDVRKIMIKDINTIVDCRKVWSNVKLEQIIYILSKNNQTENYKNLLLKNKEFTNITSIDKKLYNKFGFFVNGVNKQEIEIAEKVYSHKMLFEISNKDARGAILQKYLKNSGDIKVIGGGNIKPYRIEGIKGFIDKDLNIKLFKSAFVLENSILIQRIIAHIMNPTDHIKIIATIPKKDDFYIVDTVYQVELKNSFSNKFILVLLHSKLLNWYVYRFIFAKAIRTFQFSSDVIKKLPIPQISEDEQKPFVEKAEIMLKLHEDFYSKKQKFLKRLKSNFELDKLSKKLENFHDYDFANLLKELKKKKITLKLTEQDEWEEYFESYKKELENLQHQINQTDQEIDKMVYELYGLSEEEIRVVEGE